MTPAEQLRQVAARFAAGVTVVTTRTADGVAAGFTATAFTSVSMEPPLVLVCLSIGADCHPAFSVASALAISVLGASQADVAMKFATRGADKFAGVAVTDGERTGIPLVDGAVAHLECSMWNRVLAGDHTILIGEVLRGVTAEGEPLLYAGRAFSRVAPLF